MEKIGDETREDKRKCHGFISRSKEKSWVLKLSVRVCMSLCVCVCLHWMPT